MKIFYGILNNNIDVTDICFTTLLHNNIITIPPGDNNRCKYFTDPFYGVLKQIFIVDDIITSYDHTYTIYIENNKVTYINDNDISDKINNMHSTLKLNYGNFLDELPEQKIAFRYLTGNEKVLEIGGNIGRNSLIIGSIIRNYDESNCNNFVTLESDANIANQLQENRDANNFTFHIENSALSKKKLIQHGWSTIPSNRLYEGCNWVNTITWEELNAKYNIKFDTLILDCEGAFYYILIDMPEILDNINLIIMENDYWNILHKEYIDDILRKNFYVDYSEGGGWGPCENNFYEVWKRM